MVRNFAAFISPQVYLEENGLSDRGDEKNMPNLAVSI